MLIGMTGKSGSGKSTITKIFKELDKSIQIIDVDKIAHQSYLNISTKKNIEVTSLIPKRVRASYLLLAPSKLTLSSIFFIVLLLNILLIPITTPQF